MNGCSTPNILRYYLFWRPPPSEDLSPIPCMQHIHHSRKNDILIHSIKTSLYVARLDET